MSWGKSFAARSRQLALGDVGTTSAVNYVSLVLIALTGIVVARALGESGRGNYAAIVVWFNLFLIIAEFGQGASVTYAVSRSPAEAPRIVASSRVLLLPFAICMMIGAMAVAPFFASGDRGLVGAYRLAFLGFLPVAICGPFMYAAQALSLRLWNSIRVVQPVSNLVLVSSLWGLGLLSVWSATACLVMSFVLQMVFAYFRTLRLRIRGGKVERKWLRGLASFGGRQLGSAAPESANTSLDRLMASRMVTPSELGQYAVAQSVTSLSGPIGMAVAHVMFPRLANHRGSDTDRIRLEMRVLVMTTLSVLVILSVVIAVAPFVIPFFFGVEFVNAVALVAWIAPATLMNGLAVVTASFLRGRGLPGRVAASNVLGLVLGTFTMALTLPHLGVRGVAVGMVVTQLIVFLTNLVVLLLDNRRRQLSSRSV